jgi:hypothetical protein
MNQPETKLQILLKEIFAANDIPDMMMTSNYLDRKELLFQNQYWLTILRKELATQQEEDTIIILKEFIGMVETKIDLLQNSLKNCQNPA